MLDLAEFSRKNMERCLTAFAPGHSTSGFMLCVQEEVGELSGAILGVTGEKRRKAHKTVEDIADAVADAFTYLDLLATHLGVPLAALPAVRRRTPAEMHSYTADHQFADLKMFCLGVQMATGRLADWVNSYGRRPETVGRLFAERIASLAHCLGLVAYAIDADLNDLLPRVFNMVSDRCGSDIKIAQQSA